MATIASRTMRRTVAWTAGIASLAVGCLAAFVGLIDTQRVCFGFDEMCDGPNWGDALIAFVIAAVLFALGAGIVVRLRHHRP
jgi:hypothetical protein